MRRLKEAGFLGMNPLWIIVPVVVVVLTVMGLKDKPPEVRAFTIINQSRAFLEEAKANHPECDPANAEATNNRICQAIWRAIDAHNVAVDSLNIYCGGEGYLEGGPCNPPDNKDKRKEFGNRLRLFLQEFETIYNDLQEVTQ